MSSVLGFDEHAINNVAIGNESKNFKSLSKLKLSIQERALTTNYCIHEQDKTPDEGRAA